MAETLSALLQEGRTFPPPAGLRARTRWSPTPSVYDDAERDWQGFWAHAGARARLAPRVGHDPRLGAAVREVVRRRQAERLGELPRPPRRTPATATRSRSTGRASPATAARSPTRSCSTRRRRVANLLRELGVAKGDRVAIYMGMVPETVAAMLACARIGAAHSVVFGGFTAQSLKDRINDAEARVLDHRRRRVAARLGRRAEGDRRRGARRDAVDRARRSCCGAPSRTCAMQDGSRRLVARRGRPAEPPSARPSRWTPRTCSSSSTRRAPPGSPRASCTRPAATSRRSRTRTSTCST